MALFLFNFFSLAILLEIGDNALIAKANLDSHCVKEAWLRATLAYTNELNRLDYRAPPVNCAGHPDFSIFQHLENHSTFEIESDCDCGTFYHREFMPYIRDVREIEILGNPNSLCHADMPICEGCNDYRVLKDLRPYPHNWVLCFRLLHQNQPELPPLLSEIPRYIQMGNINYKLEYLGFILHFPSNHHAVSLHLIRNTWYEFDSGLTPCFRRWRKPRYDNGNLTLERIVYFRGL